MEPCSRNSPRLSLQGVFWALLSVASSRAIALRHLFAFRQKGCRSWSQVASREPPHCKPCPGGSSPPRCLVLPQTGTPQRLCPGCSNPRSLSPSQRPPLLVPVSPSQLCEPSLGIWFISSWQCHPPKCHGMQKSMKTRGPRHVFLFVCMCQHFQWLRNVCL